MHRRRRLILLLRLPVLHHPHPILLPRLLTLHRRRHPTSLPRLPTLYRQHPISLPRLLTLHHRPLIMLARRLMLYRRQHRILPLQGWRSRVCPALGPLPPLGQHLVSHHPARNHLKTEGRSSPRRA